MHAGLAGEEQHYQRREEHHVASQPEEHEKPNPVQALARAAMLALPVVIASSASATRGSPVNGRFSANAWFFPFNFRWGARKGNRHSRPL
jgi:hypothetical protein